MPTHDSIASRATNLEWLLFDVDGVLTNGTLLYTDIGETIKPFSVRDGLGFRLAQRAGLKLGLLSGRTSKPLERRAAELDFDRVILGARDKSAHLDDFLNAQGMTTTQVAFIGDDLPDIPVLRRCGLSFAPADAAPEVRAVVDVVLDAGGGQGAAREMIERILKARGDWKNIVAMFT